MKARITCDRWDIQINDGHGWRTQYSAYTYTEAKAQYLYCRNCLKVQEDLRMRKRREMINKDL